MNILQLNYNINIINNFIKDDNMKLIFMSNNINGTKNNILRKLKKLIDLKYGNYNYVNIDDENGIYVFFKDDIEVDLLVKLLYYYNIIKKYIKQIPKYKNKKYLIYKLIQVISNFYNILLIHINNTEKKIKRKIKKKINEIYLIYHFKYLLSKEEKKLLNLNYKEVYEYYKKKYKIKSMYMIIQ
jgi:hypothetical protein